MITFKKERGNETGLNWSLANGGLLIVMTMQ